MHLFAFKVCGLWETEKSSNLYKLWSLFFSYVICIGFPISQIICVFYVNSVNQVVDHLVLTSTVAVVPFKAFNVLYNRKKFEQLLVNLRQMDEKSFIEFPSRSAIKKKSFFITFMFLCAYLSAWILVALQVIFSPPNARIWSSTFLYPHEWFHHPVIYVGGLCYQCYSNFMLCFLDAFVDTYGAILLIILDGHIQSVGNKLQSIGQNARDSKYMKNNEELLAICRAYEVCLR